MAKRLHLSPRHREIEREHVVLVAARTPNERSQKISGQRLGATLTTWRLARMNLAIRSIDSSQVTWNNEGSFLNDSHKDLKADYAIVNPPFNDSN